MPEPPSFNVISPTLRADRCQACLVNAGAINDPFAWGYAADMENLTLEQGFRAMFLFLDDYNGQMNGTAELRDVLSDLNPAIDGKSSDPGSWSDWLKACDRAKAA